MDKNLESHVKELVIEEIEDTFGADTELVNATKAEAGLLGDEKDKTGTTVTVTLQFDGFVGVRQAEIGAAAMLGNVKNATSFDGARVVKVETEFKQGGKSFKGLASGSDLDKQMRQERTAAPSMFGPEPQPALSGHTVAPLNVEEERGGLETGNIQELGGSVGKYGIGDKVKADPGAGDTVTGGQNSPPKSAARPAPKAAPAKSSGATKAAPK